MPNIEFERYRVVVGEIGIVFASANKPNAVSITFLSQSETIGFPWPGKSIALFEIYEIIREFHPSHSEGSNGER